MALLLKCAYESAEPSDGFRVHVDRLWPRGVSKSAMHIDLWLKDVAPSTTFRKWFSHGPLKWDKFRDQYFLEFGHNPEVVEQLAAHVRHGVVTLVYGAKDEMHSHTIVLKEYLEHLQKHC